MGILQLGRNHSLILGWAFLSSKVHPSSIRDGLKKTKHFYFIFLLSEQQTLDSFGLLPADPVEGFKIVFNLLRSMNNWGGWVVGHVLLKGSFFVFLERYKN